LEISRNLIGIILITVWVSRVVNTTVAIFVAVPVIVFVLVLFSKRLQSFYQRIEGRFLTNLNAREVAEEPAGADVLLKNAYSESDLSPWEAHIVDLPVNPLASYVGKTLQELAWREQFGISIAYIKRGDKLIHAPGGLHKLLPYDRIGIIATDAQMQTFKPEFDVIEAVDAEDSNMEDIVLQKILVDEHTRLKGLSIKNSGIGEKTNGLVVGIEKNGKRILNPHSSVVFEWNDVVWIVGDRNKIQRMTKPAVSAT
jgi:monovalent cation:H+ antiporter-2, CPA2 family